MKALILCAGFATRLYPLTENFPKPLLKIKDKPIIEYIINSIEKLDINEILIITNAKFYNHFEDWLNNFKCNKRIKLLNDGTTTNQNKLGAIGDTNFVIDKESIKEDLIIIYGDNLYNFDLTEIYNSFKKTKKNIIAFIERDIEIAKRCGIIMLDKNNKIIDFEEKPQHPKSNLCSVSPFFYNSNTIKKIKEYVANKNNPDAAGYFLEWLHKNDEIYGFKFSGKWFDIGSFESLEKARKEF